MNKRPHESLTVQRHQFDVCVIGGGMSGMCAAIAAARNGAKVCLIHDRPVLGGNASSEIRMWICGAHGKENKETGVLEEILLENYYRNPSLNYSIWDGVLYGKAFFQPNLTTMLNTSVLDADMDGSRITKVRAWQLTSQVWHEVSAAQFIDCSGDSILAPLTGAEHRQGREARAEFDEDIEPSVADRKTMGNSLLIQLRKTDEPQPFVPPKWAYKITKPSDLPNRMDGVQGANFWWIELGGLQDTITDAEAIRDDLMRTVYGVWDYIKNHAPEKAASEKWAIEFIGSLPGKRENRRYVGDHVLTQNCIRAGGKFDDIVAYGGWSMDDHHPAGLLYPGRPTVFHPAPATYGIPYRVLYSRNISNLLFAGRNISTTHAALSSTRVMATCSVIGQAAGTAAALCVQHGCDPRGVYQKHLPQLQEAILDDDAWLPGIARKPSKLAASAKISGAGEGAQRVIDGIDRDLKDAPHAWVAPLGSALEFRWDHPVSIAGVRIVFDSNLASDKRMPCSYPQKGNRSIMPKTLVRAFRIEALDDKGNWTTVASDQDNYQRLVHIPIADGVKTKAIRLIPETTWGDAAARVFSFEPQEKFVAKIPAVPDGPHFSELVAKVDPKDLLPPESGLESVVKHPGA